MRSGSFRPEEKHRPGQGQPVPGKRAQRNPLDQHDKRLHRNKGRNKGHHEADAEHAQVVGGKEMGALVEIIQRGREHERHRADKRILRRQAALGPKEHPTHDGGRRARKSRP